MPAVGVAFGLERLLLALDGGNRHPAPLPADVLVSGNRPTRPASRSSTSARGWACAMSWTWKGGESQLACGSWRRRQRIGCAIDWDAEAASVLWMQAASRCATTSECRPACSGSTCSASGGQGAAVQQPDAQAPQAVSA